MAVSPTAASKPYKRMIAGLLMLAALSLAQIWLWRFVRQRAQDWHDKRSQEQQIDDLTKRNADIRHNLSEQKAYLGQVSMVVPPYQSLTQIVERLEQLSDQAGSILNVTNIKEAEQAKGTAGKAVAREKSPTALVPVAVTLEADGTADQVLNYLALVEHAPELGVVNKWSLQIQKGRSAAAGPSPSPQAMVYALNMEVTFFVQRSSL